MMGLYFLQDAVLKTCIIPQQSFKIESKCFPFEWALPQRLLCYIYISCFTFHFKRFILNPTHIGTLFRHSIGFAGP